MHTPEQAKELWCPMARIAQIGAAETNATYNRALIKSHVPVKLMDPDQELNLGEDAKTFIATVLKTETQISVAARCLGTGCAAWRWGTFIAPPADAKPGRLVSGVNHRAEWGYCGLAGTPAST